jgi:translation initiation factor 1A
MKRRVWIREHDIVLVAPWDFDDDRADVLWRYIKAHEEYLAKNNYLPAGF